MVLQHTQKFISQNLLTAFFFIGPSGQRTTLEMTTASGKIVPGVGLVSGMLINMFREYQR